MLDAFCLPELPFGSRAVWLTLLLPLSRAEWEESGAFSEKGLYPKCLEAARMCCLARVTYMSCAAVPGAGELSALHQRSPAAFGWRREGLQIPGAHLTSQEPLESLQGPTAASPFQSICGEFAV